MRRLPLLIVLLLLAWLFLGDRPREVLIIYDLPDDPRPFRAEVKLRDRDGAIPAQIIWGTGTSAAADQQPQHARLRPGTYRIEALLEYPDGTRREIERSLPISREDEQIVVHLR